jgi:hypothetical protein
VRLIVGRIYVPTNDVGTDWARRGARPRNPRSRHQLGLEVREADGLVAGLAARIPTHPCPVGGHARRLRADKEGNASITNSTYLVIGPTRSRPGKLQRGGMVAGGVHHGSKIAGLTSDATTIIAVGQIIFTIDPG